MNENNVKIKINEVDQTTAANETTDTTDVVFVPGFSIKGDAPFNKPVLCRTVEEFESTFGKQPYMLSSAVIQKYDYLGLNPNTPDYSYVYARSLIAAGLPVVYVAYPVDVDDVIHTDGTLVMGTLSYDQDGVFDGYRVDTDLTRHNMSVTTYSDSAVSEVKLRVNIPLLGINIPNSRHCYKLSNNYTVSGANVSLKLNTDNIYSGAPGYSSDYPSLTINTISDIEVHISDPHGYHGIVECEVTLTPIEGDFFSSEYITLSNLECEQLILCSDPLINIYQDTGALVNTLKNDIADKSLYSVKYITSGGYPSVYRSKNADGTYETNATLANAMLSAAAARGDAVALIDYMKDSVTPAFDLGNDNSFYNIMQKEFNNKADNIDTYTYGAAWYPWAQYSTSLVESGNIDLPASYGYLRCLAKATKTSPNWLAMAGVSRGVVPGIKKLYTPNNLLSNKVAEEMQPKEGEENQYLSINCITEIRPYGLTIWGNRTMHPVDANGTVARNFLNTRNMLSDIKKLLYTTAQTLMFEQNSTLLWLKFKGMVSPLLDSLKLGNGISDYKLIKVPTTTKGKLEAVIRIYPVYAVEYFDLTVEIRDDDVVVS